MSKKSLKSIKLEATSDQIGYWSLDKFIITGYINKYFCNGVEVSKKFYDNISSILVNILTD